MSIKRKTGVGKAYAYRMLWNFKTSVTHTFFLATRWTTVSVVKQFLLDKTRFFAGYCPMPAANIQASILEHTLSDDAFHKKSYGNLK